MHEQRFPKSDEPVDQQTSRAIAGLEYEDEAGLGFRRVGREFGVTNEFDPGARVETSESTGQLWASYIAAAGVIAAVGSAVYRPLTLGFIAFLGALIGVAAGGRAADLGRLGFILLGIFFVIGMVFAITQEMPLY